MADEPKLEEFENEAEYKMALEEYQQQQKQVVDEPPPLPDGFEPAKYGLVSKDDLTKLQKERDEFEKRYNDTRTQFNQERTSVHRELDEIRSRMGNGGYGHQPVPQPVSSGQALAAYQRDQTLESYNAYQQALIRESLHPQLESLRDEFTRAQQQMAAQGERLAFHANPAYANVNDDEIASAFNPLRGGTSATLEEGYYVIQARKVGGFPKLIEQFRKEGESKLLEDVKSGKHKFQNIPPGTSPRKERYTPGIDYDRMTDEEIIKMSEDKNWGI